MSFWYVSAFLFIFSGFTLKKRIDLNEPLDMSISSATKGIAAIWVILTHCNQHFDARYGFLNSGFAAVSLFFFWSGYGMTRSVDKNPAYLKSFWKNRLVKLMIPYFVALAIYFLAKHFLNLSVKVSDF